MLIKKLLVGMVVLFASLRLHASGDSSPLMVLWDDAVIASDTDLSKVEAKRFLFSNKPLNLGDRFTALVPLGPGYRVLCCLDVTDGRGQAFAELAKKYSYDRSFIDRLKAMRGVQWAYEAALAPEDVLSPAMKRKAKGFGEIYFSAPALLGQTNQQRIDKDVFEWGGFGVVSLTTSRSGGNTNLYTLRSQDAGVSIAAPRLAH